MLRDFSLRDFGASLNTVESYTNESSQGKIGLCETVNKQKCTHLGMFLASEAWGAPYTISYACCPFCGDYEIINDNEYHHCDNCGEVCEEYIATEDGRYYCENCYTVKHLN